MNAREAQLPLLGPAFESQTPDSFFAYVKSLYAERVRGRKVRPTPIRGRVLKAPTKRAAGAYEITRGLLKTTIALAKPRAYDSLVLKTVAEALACDDATLRVFFKMKKFAFVDKDSLTTS
jgi:hypothetical protein